MPFPEVSRVSYELNPLEEVLCQIRFPPILKIEAESPHAFQERVRGRLPQYKAKMALVFPPDMPSDLTALMSKDLGFVGPQKAHEFANMDGTWALSLSRESMSLRCAGYERWEFFQEHFAGPYETLRELYLPASIVRIGLRYKNVIRRSRLGLEGVGWEELLKPWVASAYTEPEIRGDIESNGHQLMLRLPENRGHALINHGTGDDSQTRESCYIIDADFYDDSRSEPGDVVARLQFLHGQAGRFFRGCITDRLHLAMRPRPLSAY